MLLAKERVLFSLRPEFPMKTEVTAKDLQAPVTVHRDRWAVPHIYGENLEDLYYVLGYMQAEDRLFQMDFLRRMAMGGLSEVVGEDAYEMDVFYRTIGLGRAARATVKAYDELDDSGFKAAMKRYVDGVNGAIQKMIEKDRLPIEFKVLGYTPEPWTSVDSSAIINYMGWLLTGRFTQVGYSKARESLGEFVDLLYPFDRPYETPIVGVYDADIAPVTPFEKVNLSTEGSGGAVGGLNTRSANVPEKRLWRPSFKPLYASNNWVVSGSLTDTGKPILCNDPHLPLTAPPIWYEAHLVYRDEDKRALNIRGVTIPGLPYVMSGRNQRVAWGLTNVGADVLDLYRYDWSEDDKEYRYHGDWETPTEIAEKIRVKKGDAVEEREHIIRFTGHGPLLDIDGERYAMKWIGHYPNFSGVSCFKMNLAMDMEEFREALRLISYPAQNIAYADVDGNISWWACGRYPIRSNVSDEDDFLEYRVPFNGSEGRGEWGDWDDPGAWVAPPDEVPHTVNPPEGYIVTANNCPVRSREFPHWLGWRWAESHRVNRIVGLLKGAGALNVEKMQRVQTDVHSIPAEKLVLRIVEMCSGRELDDGVEAALDELRRWDHEMEEDRVAASIFVRWLERFRVNAFPEALNREELGSTPTTEALIQLFDVGEEAWKDINEDISNVVALSLREAVEQLKTEYGENMDSWSWGRVNSLRVAHPLGSAIPWFNQPALPADGYLNCVNPGGGRHVTYHTSWRQIIDLGDQGNSVCVLPGGELGHPFSGHYRDQLNLWLQGKYKPMTMPVSPEKVEGVISTVTFHQ